MNTITLSNGRTVLAREVHGVLKPCEYTNQIEAARRALEVSGQAIRLDTVSPYFVAVDEEAKQTTSNQPRDLSFITEPVEIDVSAYLEGLEILPPLDFVICSETESFKWGEFLCGRVTRTYCRVGRRYFFMHNLASLKHHAIVEIVRAAMDAKPRTTN